MEVRKSGFRQAIPLIIAISLISFPAYAQYSGGTGEPNDPYRIAMAEDLMLLGESPEDYDKHFVMVDDIDLDPNLAGRKIFDRAVIAPDVNDTEPRFQGTTFTGVFDGNGYTISHLSIDVDGKSCIGLFGKLGSGACISDLGLEAVDINGTGDYVGGLSGRIGEWYGTDIIVTNCYSIGEVSGDSIVGGLVGSNNGSITLCFSTGSFSGAKTVGGLVGTSNGNITSCYSTGSVSGTGNQIGGLAGLNWGNITSCCSSSSVTGDEHVGGLAGGNGGSVTSSYNTGSVRGSFRAGGLVGKNWGSITSCYSTGAVAGNNDVGGLVGDNNSSNFRPGSITASFWDIETSGQAKSDGGTGLTTSEMQDIDIYLSEGWDFVDEAVNGTCDYWQISPGNYPQLRYPTDENLRMPEGLGTAEQPYLIRDANDLGTMWLKPMAHYRLETSLDLSEITWSVPVVPWFGGTFNGNDHVISNLHIQGGGYLGLFGQLGFGAKISNIVLEAADIRGTGEYIGTLAGFTGDSWYAPDRIVVNCYSTGSVSGNSDVGGLVGLNAPGSSITSCYYTGEVSGNDNVGGLVGNGVGDITNSYSTGEVSGNDNVGGLVGAGRNITNSYSNGSASGNHNVGGLVGKGRGNITNSYSTGSVSGDWDVGGLVGNKGDHGSITSCYSTGAVTGGNNAGGLVGRNWGSITSCYSTGAVTGDNNVGGLLGCNHDWRGNHGTVNNSFWDIQTSGLTNMCGRQYDEASGCDDIFGKNTSEMHMADTFLEVGWDFVDETENGTEDIWLIIEGQDYPRLWWELSSEPIEGSDGIDFWPGTSFIYQTNFGRYGTFIVEDLNKGWNNQLTIAWVTYNSDGTVYSSGSGLVIRGTWLVDLDEGVELASDDEAVVDWHWRQHTSTTRSLSPWNNAKFKLIYRGSLKPSIP